MKPPLFSVIIPSYNRREFLTIAIKSVINQTFSDFELIIIDDGSTDQTLEMVKSFDDNRIHYFFQETKGPASARNLGLRNAKGQFICFLDSDDRFRSIKLAKTFCYIQKHPQCKIFHSQEIWYRNGKIMTQKVCHKKPNGMVFESAAKICSISISTAAIKKEVFSEISGFDEAMPTCEDYDFWLRAAAKYEILLIPEYLTIKEGGHPDQLSKKFEAMDKFRIYALEKFIKISRPTPVLRQIAIRELKKKCRVYLQGAAKREETKETSYYKKLITTFDGND